jgi:hypothetical protein
VGQGREREREKRKEERRAANWTDPPTLSVTHKLRIKYL